MNHRSLARRWTPSLWQTCPPAEPPRIRRQGRRDGRPAEAFLGELELHHERRLRHRTEERMEWLARPEIERAVLHLHEDVVAELSVEGFELVVRLPHAILRHFAAVDERSPDHHAAVRREGIGEHVGTVRIPSALVLRTRLALRVRLHAQ